MHSEVDLSEAEGFLRFVDSKIVDDNALHWNNVQRVGGIDVDVPLCVSAPLDNLHFKAQATYQGAIVLSFVKVDKDEMLRVQQ